MPQDVVQQIVEETGAVAYRYRLWPTPGYEYISESVIDLLGYSAQELYTDPALPGKIVYPEDHALMRSVLDAPSGREVDLELRWVSRDGRIVWTNVRCVLLRDATGRPIRVDGVAQHSRRQDELRQRLDLIEMRGRLPAADETAHVARVVVVDDQDLVRRGLRLVLGEDPHLELVGEASNGYQAIELVRALQPDLVLMDVRMPDLDGLQATRVLKQSNPMTSVLILTMYEDIELLVEAIKAGAAGYVLKAASETELRSAIWQALRGEMPVDTHLAREALRRLANEQSLRPGTPAPHSPLSKREHEVLQLLAGGSTNREIADKLVVAQSTVKVHVEHILAKLEVSDRTQAAVRAIDLGYVTRGGSAAT